MSNKKQHIEEMFQGAFEHFEADVNPKLWSNIQSQIGAQPAPVSDGGASATSASVTSGISAGVAKIAAIVGVAGTLVAGGMWLSQSEEKQEASLDTQSVETLLEETPESQESIAIEKEDNVEKELSFTDQKAARDEQEENAAQEKRANDALTDNAITHQNSEHSIGTESVSSTDPATSVSNDSEMPVPPPPVEEVTDKKQESPVMEDDSEKKSARPLEASIYASVRRGEMPLLVQFSNRGSDAEKIRWDFGDGNVKHGEQAPYHEFNTPGKYQVILTVEDDLTHVAYDTVEIVVNKKISMMIPGVLTPNGDGYNDTFKIELSADNIRSFECKITDRNMNEVYRIDNVYGHWDGKDRYNNAVSEGSYFYFVTVVPEDGEPILKKGVILLKR